PWTFPVSKHRAHGPVGFRRTGQIGLMRLLPFARHVILRNRRRIDLMMDPAMPAWRNQRGLRNAVIDHPATGTALGILASLVIDIAELILADTTALAPGMEARTERLS